MSTGRGSIDVSDCDDSNNCGTYTLERDDDGSTWAFTANPSTAESPLFTQNEDGSYQFRTNKGPNHACFVANWGTLPDGAPDSTTGLCTGCTIDAYGFETS